MASNFTDGMRSDELKTMLVTHFVFYAGCEPTPDDMRRIWREYLLIKPKAENRYKNYGNYKGMNIGAGSGWYRSRDE